MHHGALAHGSARGWEPPPQARGERFNLGSDAEPYFVHGILRKVELVHHHAGKALYRLTLVPRLWNLTQTLHSRVFTDLTIVEIIEKLLKKGGLRKGQEVEFKLLATYPTLEHVCQYKESQFAFISRWKEREGLYYFFEQKDDGDKLVITDSISSHGGLESGRVRYVPTGNDDFMALEHFSHFCARHAATPADVLLTDYDYLSTAAYDAGGGWSLGDGGERRERKRWSAAWARALGATSTVG